MLKTDFLFHTKTLSLISFISYKDLIY